MTRALPIAVLGAVKATVVLALLGVSGATIAFCAAALFTAVLLLGLRHA